MIVAFEATRVAISTCGSVTSFLTDIALFDGAPTVSNWTELARASSASPDAVGCTTLIHDIDAEGSYFLTVEGRGAGEEGAFELSVGCLDLPSAPVDDTCAHSFITCTC